MAPRISTFAAIALFAAILSSCKGVDESAPVVEGLVDAALEASLPTGPCGAVVQQQAIEGFLHVPVCSLVEYGTKPPSSGNHYPIWAAYKTYSVAIPHGFWVHNLEHGTVALSYNCPEGCDSDVAGAQQMLDALPADPTCVSLGQGVQRRSIMMPDPSLDVRFAASAWGWTLRANCFDATAFQAFALAHYDHGREDICADGEDLSGGVQDGCGEP